MTDPGCAWSQVAHAWDTHAGDIEKTSGDATKVMLDAAAIGPDDSVLELGGGTGHLAVRLADLLGPHGSLVASDVVPEMVALTAQKLADRPNCTAKVIDAASIPEPDETFDVVLSRMGLMFVPEPTDAFREIRRVLRPGGRLAAAVWADAAKNTWMTAVGMAAAMGGQMSPPEPGVAGPFSLGDPDALEALAVGAGLTDVSVETVSWMRHYDSAADHFDTVRVLAPPIAAAFAAATDQQMNDVRATAQEIIAPYRLEDGSYDIPACALVLRAIRP